MKTNSHSPREDNTGTFRREASETIRSAKRQIEVFSIIATLIGIVFAVAVYFGGFAKADDVEPIKTAVTEHGEQIKSIAREADEDRHRAAEERTENREQFRYIRVQLGEILKQRRDR